MICRVPLSLRRCGVVLHPVLAPLGGIRDVAQMPALSPESETRSAPFEAPSKLGTSHGKPALR